MQLSVIVVSYNVRLLLEHCLHSLYADLDHASEVIVVDNNSSDDTISMLEKKFPSCKVIANNDNLGFAKACNQGAQIARGNHLLFLNPDTVIHPGTLSRCISEMNKDQTIGAIGVRMINADGKYLPESKRGNPNASASFFKLFGVHRLFPHSKYFSAYYQGHLDEKQNHFVDVLSGAFLLVRSEIFKLVGGFDEDYFMYGEDIDLSIRIRKAGYKNFYLGEVTIMHLKGQSTPKNKQTIQHFYNSMKTYVEKHHSSDSKIKRQLLLGGIKLRRGLAMLRHKLR